MKNMKRIFISLLCLLLIGQNLSPVMFAEENPSGISENVSGMAENWSGSDDVLLWGKEVAPTWSGTEDFYESDESSKNPQSSTSSNPVPLDKGAQSWENLDSSALPQNDGSDEQAPQSHNAPSSPDNWPLMAPWQVAEITLNAEKTDIVADDPATVVINASFNQPTNNTILSVTVPENITYISHLVSPIEDLEPVLSTDIETKDGAKILKIHLKDNIVWELSMSVSVKFLLKNSYYWEIATIRASISQSDEEVVESSLSLKQNNSSSKIYFYWGNYTLSPNVSRNIVNWQPIYLYWYWGNIHIEIPLPDGLSITWDIVCAKCTSIMYDSDSHAIVMDYPETPKNWFAIPFSATIVYTWTEIGTLKAPRPIVVTGKEGGKKLKTFTGGYMTVKIVDWVYSASTSIISHGNRNEFLASNVWGPLYIFNPIRNNGTLDIEELEVELTPPPEVQIKTIQIPPLSTRKWWDGEEVDIYYDTNIQSWLSLHASIPSSAQHFWKEALWMSDDEYITCIKIKMKNVEVGGMFSYAQSSAAGANLLRYYGDVSYTHPDGTPIQEWEKLTTQRIIRVNGEEIVNDTFQTRWTNIPYVSRDVAYTYQRYDWDKIEYNRGEKMQKKVCVWNRSYPDGNGGTAYNPNIYLVVDNNLTLDTDLSHRTNSANIKITSLTEITSQIYGNVGDSKVYKVATEAKIPLANISHCITVPFVVNADAVPGTYSSQNTVFVNFDHGFYTSSVDDSFGILWPVNKNKIAHVNYAWNHVTPYTIIWSSYWASSRIKSPLDSNRKAWYDTWDDSSLSIITDNTSSTYRQIFYNESSEDMHNLDITIPLPQKNDENWSQWRWILSWEVVVSWATADITYSSDGTTYQPYSSFTNPSQIKNIKLHVATWPAKSQVVVDTDIIATWNPSDGQIAKITSEWTFWGQNFGSQIQAMVYHPAPKATITYSPSTPTTWGVVATISFDQANVEITNNSWNVDYLFTQTGEFLYEWRSMRNITWTTLARVTWIIPEPTTPTLTKYTVTFVDDDGTTVLRPATEYDYGTPASDILRPSDPTKKWYKFTWWTPSITDVTWDVVYKATYKKDWWGWGRSWAEHPDPECEWDCKCKWDCEDPEPEHGSPEEERDMHRWAYDNWLTIYKPWEDAKFDKPLTRQQMAKISSVFWTNFLNQKADASEKKIYECSQYSDLDKSKWEMRWYVIQSCLMKNMWYHYDNVNYIPKFKPYDKLSVAQASVILSRMAWWTKYVISPKMWYQWHMQAVYDHGLIDDISDPSRKITRWEAFMMMYRLDKLMNESEK